MIITVTLHCQGFQGPCSSAISTGLRDSIGLPTSAVRDGNTNVTTGALASSARNGGWDVRPVATGEGETIHARCPRCRNALLDWTAKQIAEQVAAVQHGRDTPGDWVPADQATGGEGTTLHACTTPTFDGSDDDYRTTEQWRCTRCGTLWTANREHQSWTRSQP
jgi:uncharacterized C2H2 Zn-finger protein